MTMPQECPVINHNGRVAIILGAFTPTFEPVTYTYLAVSNIGYTDKWNGQSVMVYDYKTHGNPEDNKIMLNDGENHVMDYVCLETPHKPSRKRVG